MQKHRFNVRLGSLLWSAERGKSWPGSDREGKRHGNNGAPAGSVHGKAVKSAGLCVRSKIILAANSVFHRIQWWKAFKISTSSMFGNVCHAQCHTTLN